LLLVTSLTASCEARRQEIPDELGYTVIDEMPCIIHTELYCMSNA